mmetsp:Transcript_32366/g.52326  ORF Transcript_32366/g.52326 Transcript_32366/m.52326 type:complete len:96 (-) Transcript_32366:283-570(-)
MPQASIQYSEKYFDEQYEYRHVILPPDIAKIYQSTYKGRLMTEAEWRGLGVQQSRGWVHYMTHRPEPHILLFRRDVEPSTAAKIKEQGLHAVNPT